MDNTFKTDRVGVMHVTRAEERIRDIAASPEPAQPSAPDDDVEAELERLAKLYDAEARGRELEKR
jgi:hypothetical protein